MGESAVWVLLGGKAEIVIIALRQNGGYVGSLGLGDAENSR